MFDVVEQIPPGRVSTYGAIGRLIGIGPRRVARALSSGGGAVPWYRVVRADGPPPSRCGSSSWPLAAEGVPMRDGRVDLPPWLAGLKDPATGAARGLTVGSLRAGVTSPSVPRRPADLRA